jgi:hypothetical protein
LAYRVSPEQTLVTHSVAIHCVATRFVAVADRSVVPVNRDALADHCAALQIVVLHGAAPNAVQNVAPNVALNGVRKSFADERALPPVAPVVFQEQTPAC